MTILISLRKNKALIICAVIAEILSCVFSILIENERGIKAGNPFVMHIIIPIIILIVFLLAYYFGRTAFNKGYLIIAIIGTAVSFTSMFVDYDSFGLFNMSAVNLYDLTNILAIAGLSVYFLKKPVGSIGHSVLYFLLSFLFMGGIDTYRTRYLLIAAIIISILLVVIAFKEHLFATKTIAVLNTVFTALLAVPAVYYAVGIPSSVKNSAFHVSVINARLFGAAEGWGEVDVCISVLNWIFGCWGIAAGLIMFVSIAAFVYFVCKKALKTELSDKTPINISFAVIIIVRFVCSTLITLGVVLSDTPVPFFTMFFECIGMTVLFGIMVGENDKSSVNPDDKEGTVEINGAV